jgi:hypothetical protein
MRLKKRTYVIDIKSFPQVFCDHYTNHTYIPVTILSVNGQKIPRPTSEIPTKLLPSFETIRMLADYYYKPKTHTQYSLTVVEYHTRKQEPIAYLYPNGMVSYTKRPTNNAIRRDIVYQIALRKNALSK